MEGLPSCVDQSQKSHSLYEGIPYEEFWFSQQQAKLDELEQHIVKELLPVAGTRFIDVGCGYGRLSDCYLNSYRQVVMFDGSMSLLQKAQEKTARRGIYIAGDVTHLPFKDASFNGALMVRVFHHIDDSNSCLSELQRILCDCGQLTFSFHNKCNLRRLANWVKSKVSSSIFRQKGGSYTVFPLGKDPDGIGTTLISHHPKYVYDLLQKAGFSNLVCRGAGVIDKLVTKFRKLHIDLPCGKNIAPLMGKTHLAPWIFCSGITKGNKFLRYAQTFDDLLQCPICRNDLRKGWQCYICNSCEHEYPINDDIIDFRI